MVVRVLIFSSLTQLSPELIQISSAILGSILPKARFSSNSASLNQGMGPIQG
jgi:hypothetical protein